MPELPVQPNLLGTVVKLHRPENFREDFGPIAFELNRKYVLFCETHRKLRGEDLAPLAFKRAAEPWFWCRGCEGMAFEKRKAERARDIEIEERLAKQTEAALNDPRHRARVRKDDYLRRLGERREDFLEEDYRERARVARRKMEHEDRLARIAQQRADAQAAIERITKETGVNPYARSRYWNGRSKEALLRKSENQNENSKAKEKTDEPSDKSE